ncbi:MAG: hypothetical protein DMG49_07410 [Acidobacteria bacterium]|nr:MAG: hypothetical protein DMG49_07410 [Acidobacteriota bacterium]
MACRRTRVAPCKTTYTSSATGSRWNACRAMHWQALRAKQVSTCPTYRRRVMRSRDILLAFNGKPVKELQDLLKETRQIVAGTAVSVTVLRYQQESTVMILRKP